MQKYREVNSDSPQFSSPFKTDTSACISTPWVFVRARVRLCVWRQVVLNDNGITILSLFTGSHPVGWIKLRMVDSAGGTARKEWEKFLQAGLSELSVGCGDAM